MFKTFLVAVLFVSVSLHVHAHAKPLRKHRTLARRFRSQPDCPDDAPLGKKDLSSFISGQLAQINSALTGPGSQEKSLTYVDRHGVPDKVNIKEVVSADATGGTSKHWSWSWSSHTSNANSQTKDGLVRPIVKEQPSGDYASPVKADSTPRVVSTKSHSYQYVHSYGKHGNQSYDSSNFSYSDSYTTSLIVNDYVVTSHVSKSANSAPFFAAQVEWLKEPNLPATINVPSGAHIPRPADANLCNAKFPFNGQTYHGSSPRFESVFPAQHLDPISKRALDLHNIERARYGLTPLQWNTELANMAACWADLKAYGHSEDHFCATGENIAYGYGAPCYTSPLSGLENAINSFLDEDRTYATKRQFGEDTGHWTQIVWKDTKYVGCATSQRRNFLDEQDTSIYLVCEYYPAGNILGQFELKVPEPKPTGQYRSQCSANELHWS